jgi:hypothetical protein
VEVEVAETAGAVGGGRGHRPVVAGYLKTTGGTIDIMMKARSRSCLFLPPACFVHSPMQLHTSSGWSSTAPRQVQRARLRIELSIQMWDLYTLSRSKQVLRRAIT